jgi:hypothetical protein
LGCTVSQILRAEEESAVEVGKPRAGSPSDSYHAEYYSASPEPLGAEDAVMELPTEVASGRTNNLPSVKKEILLFMNSSPS